VCHMAQPNYIAFLPELGKGVWGNLHRKTHPLAHGVGDECG
jgi:hypothetical protein